MKDRSVLKEQVEEDIRSAMTPSTRGTRIPWLYEREPYTTFMHFDKEMSTYPCSRHVLST